jgi:uncharacterized membrane protein YedE/YeeE
MKIVISFIVGLLFALGLGISGMTNTIIVKGFLDIFGTWNLNLMGVMIGAILIHTIVYHLIKNKPSPLLDTKFHLPTTKVIDKKLILGALIFGLGWGWAGICPGPGIVSLASGKTEVLIFVGSMVAGMYLFKFVEKKI